MLLLNLLVPMFKSSSTFSNYAFCPTTHPLPFYYEFRSILTIKFIINLLAFVNGDGVDFLLCLNKFVL